MGQRLLIGGGRFLDFQGEKTHQPGITDTIQAYLLSQLARLTGMEESEIEVADRWSGIMGFTPGRLQPLVELREQGSVAVAAGMNGMGTALGPYLGKKAAEMLISAREGRKVQLPVRGYLPFHSKKDLDRAKRGKEREKQEKEYGPIICIDKKQINQWYQIHPECENLVNNLSDYSFLKSIMAECKYVYHLACNMGGMGFIANNRTDCMMSIIPDALTVKAAIDRKIEKFFFASSACVYPDYAQNGDTLVDLSEDKVYPAMPEDGYGWGF